MKINIETSVAAPIADTWQAFNNPEDIVQWDASDDWHTTRASNDLKVGGKLLLRIEANEGGLGFDFAATYTQIELNRLIEFRDDDGRVVRLDFVESDKGVTIRQTFDAESTQTEDQQRKEWQIVLNRFARYVERQFTTE
ncbi:SRPBCC domain-containing protein [Pseudomonas sp. PMCC200344]|uniref:SRPBCC domain-containing protein n=1 Tax=Pseudomonas sp. PMCC200344 TaxID=3042028 RepID=UPI0024B34EBC|nr:SRPBCC domain-containing protein [Pseudomonas sp. PMCC200344]